MSSWISRHTNKKKIIPVNISSNIPIQKIDLSKERLYITNSTERINTFHSNNSDAIITFIIPTIGRNTLLSAIESISNQTINNWKAIIIFDACLPTDDNLLIALNNDRFLPICIDKAGQMGIVHNSAGKVRNIAMNLVKTEWIGFLDDDDKLLPTYTSKLLEEIKLNPTADVIIFRMLNEISSISIIPQLENPKLEAGNVGISFCLKTQLVPGFNFEQSELEDFTLINKLKNSNIKMIISPYITYLINNTSFKSNLIQSVGPRITIN
jgi:glycosyltransferase involved in cell wall biosynthesis